MKTEETLNIEWHKKQMVLKALNKARTIKTAAGLLGISERNLYRYRKDYNIRRDESTDRYRIVEQLKRSR